MRIVHVVEQPSETHYQVACRAFISVTDNVRPPFGSSMCTLEPLQASEPHRHHEVEAFYLCSGVGEVSSDGKKQVVRGGDLIVFDSFTDHSITNTSDSESLQFLALYWEDLSRLSLREAWKGGPESTLIFTAPPTPNGDLHLGHISGPFSGADIHRRFLKLRGARAYHSCGQDDHQSYVVRMAAKERLAPQALADRNAGRIQETLAQAKIHLFHFHKPQESLRHTRLTQEGFEKLYREGFIYEKEVNTAYCRETGQYLYEAHISGTCPHCLAPSDGNACENCGRPNDCSELINARSNVGTAGVEIRTSKRLFFRLGAFADRLASYHRLVSLPTRLTALVETMLRDGLPDICVAHPSDWGIQVPLPQYSSHRIYVWFEMAFGYLASAEEVASLTSAETKKSREGACEYYRSADHSVVHFFGFDNSYFHTLLLPAIYMAYDSSLRLPDAYVVNELLSLDGSKFSTSRGHLIWARELLALVGSDYVRYYLALIRPETSKNDFRLEDFESTIQRELCGKWQGWLSQVFRRCDQYYKGNVPEPGAWTEDQRTYFTRLLRTVDEIELSYTTKDFSPSRVCVLVADIVREATRFSGQQAPLYGAPHLGALARTAMALELLTAKIIAVVISPIMPDFGERLFSDLAGEEAMEWSTLRAFCPCGVTLPRRGSVYFPNVSELLTGQKLMAKVA